MDTLGDRMKMLEMAEAGRMAMPLVPVMIRLDGKAFHTWTKGLDRPFDIRLSEAMARTTEELVDQCGAIIGYTQSDEISLVLYSDRYDSQIFFNGRIQKLVSVTASICTFWFNHFAAAMLPNRGPALFDCRVWTVPNKMEAVNTLLWRELDATKNSISMAAQAYFSHKELQNKHASEMHDMLYSKGINWDKYPDFFKRGTYVARQKVIRAFTAEEIDKLPAAHEARKNPNLTVERTELKRLSLPPLTKITNRLGVIFDGETPQLRETD